MLGQRERAARLFALALKARENGDDSLADKLVTLALEILDDAPAQEPQSDDPKSDDPKSDDPKSDDPESDDLKSDDPEKK